MRVDRIVCLANSYKHDNRCVAGISLVTKKWVRLIGRTIPGCLTRHEARYLDGAAPAPLDVIELELDDACGSNSHPEDVFVARTPWRCLKRFDTPSEFETLLAAVISEPVVLEGYSDRIDMGRFEKTPAKASLALISPEDLWWWIRDDKGKRRFRAIFRLGNAGRVRYDLPVTDPAWLDQLHLLPSGIFPHAMLCGNPCPRTLLTASLSEPFDGFHYKLIAGVINFPISLKS
jgi:hypothetical protein